MSKDQIRIKSGNQYYGGPAIEKDVAKINKEADLLEELSLFRLASVHKDLALASQAPNVVLVNLRIKFKSNSGIDGEYVIPVAVTQGDDRDTLAYYSGENVDGKEFFKFYKSVLPSIKILEPKSHYHSEPFLAYYLCSEDGKKFLRKEFLKKGLITHTKDGNGYESSVSEITGISLDMHSTKVVCFNCAPFLRAAEKKLLASFYESLSLSDLPKDERVAEIDLNVSATSNFNWGNISKTNTFRHVPVLERESTSILTNTEDKLGSTKSELQKTGEASNRTYFLSGSRTLGNGVIKARQLDDKNWEKLTESAAVKIQRAWRKYSSEKMEEELVETREEILSKEQELSKLKMKVIKVKDKLEVIKEIDDLIAGIESGEITSEDEYFLSQEILEDIIENKLFRGVDHLPPAEERLELLSHIRGNKDELEEKEESYEFRIDSEKESLIQLYAKQEAILEKKMSKHSLHDDNEKKKFPSKKLIEVAVDNHNVRTRL